jgi:hypothetical protein
MNRLLILIWSYVCNVYSQVRIISCQTNVVIHQFIEESLLCILHISEISVATHPLKPEWSVYSPSLTCFLLCVVFSCTQHLGMVCWWSICLPCIVSRVEQGSLHCYFIAVLPSCIINEPLLDPNCGGKKICLFKVVKGLWQWSYLFLKVKEIVLGILSVCDSLNKWRG